MKKAPSPIAGAKNIHWFSEETENDVTKLPDFGFGGDDSEEDKSEKISEDEQRVKKCSVRFRKTLCRLCPKTDTT